MNKILLSKVYTLQAFNKNFGLIEDATTEVEDLSHH